MKLTAYGRCRLCGLLGDLSPEHNPAKKAFNNTPTFDLDYWDWLFNHTWTRRGKKNKQSINYTICPFCNNLTSPYAQEYVKIAKQAQFFKEQIQYSEIQYNETVGLNFKNVYPARLARALLTMIFVVNGPNFRDKHPELVNFVMNDGLVGIPSQYKIHLNLCDGQIVRKIGLSGIAHFEIENGKHYLDLISCVDFRPLSVMFSIDHNYQDFEDINYLSQYRNSDKLDQLTLRCKKLFCYSPYPGDYGEPLVKLYR